MAFGDDRGGMPGKRGCIKDALMAESILYLYIKFTTAYRAGGAILRAVNTFA